MITIITDKPTRSIDIKGYGVDSYIDKNNKRIYRVYGIVEPGSRGRLVSRDSDVIKDLYIDDTTIVIYRNENRDLCVTCKGMIDAHIARGVPVFGVEEFKQWVREQTTKTKEDIKEEEKEKEVDINVN